MQSRGQRVEETSSERVAYLGPVHPAGSIGESPKFSYDQIEQAMGAYDNGFCFIKCSDSGVGADIQIASTCEVRVSWESIRIVSTTAGIR
jgi:hypothetical protein